jgi:hypothetical protein
MGYPRFENDTDWANSLVARFSLSCTGHDVIAALYESDNARFRDRVNDFMKRIAITDRALGVNIRGMWNQRKVKSGKVLSYTDNDIPVSAAEVNEYTNMLKQAKELQKEKDQLEERIAEINTQLTRYAPILNVQQTLATAVKSVRSDLETLPHQLGLRKIS